MTYNDLCADVTALGFEDQLEADDRLLCATRRALRIIFTERPLHKVIRFFQSPISPVIKIDNISHMGGDVDTIPFNAKAYSFKTTGNGSYRIIDEGGTKTIDFSGSESIQKGFLFGEGRLEFLGNYSFTVYDLAIFDEITGKDESDIPLLCDFIEYDVKNYTDDFLAFSSPPENEYGIPISHASVGAGKIRIPANYIGKVRLPYKAAPASISGDPDEELVLPDGCEHLLALLVASFVWLDDDADKAQYYMNLYREGMAAVKFYDRSSVNSSYQDVLGWA